MTQNSSNSSNGKSGNTKQISPSKHWCFTLNNYTKSNIDTFLNISSSIVPRYVFQEETGENGTKHLQGYLCFQTKRRPHSVISNKRIHWENTKNIQAAIAYCQKEDTRTGEIYRRGIDPPYELELPEIYEWEQEIIDILKNEPDNRSIYWFHEPNGCAGKTTFSKWLFIHYERCIVLSGKSADMKNGIIKYKETNHNLPKIILINIPRSQLDFVSYTGLEEIKDMFFYSGKYEGGMVCGPSPHVFIFANEPPDYTKMSLDRFKVYKI